MHELSHTVNHHHIPPAQGPVDSIVVMSSWVTPWMVNKNSMEFPYIITHPCRFISLLSVGIVVRLHLVVETLLWWKYVSLRSIYPSWNFLARKTIWILFCHIFLRVFTRRKKNDKASLPLWPTNRICSKRPKIHCQSNGYFTTNYLGGFSTILKQLWNSTYPYILKASTIIRHSIKKNEKHKENGWFLLTPTYQC